MDNPTLVKYTGATPGADSNDYILFCTCTAFGYPKALQLIGAHRMLLELCHANAGTLKTYRSEDNGATWIQTSEETVQPPGAKNQTERDYLFEGAPHWRLTWTNGGADQSTRWAVGMCLVDSRNPGV